MPNGAKLLLVRLLLSLGLAAIACAANSQNWPQTRAERTNYAETSHYTDVIDFLHNLERTGAPIAIETIGTSTEGHDMPLVIASYPRISTPLEAKRLNRPIVYVQANIHAGEVEGKEAILAILRRLSQDGPKGLLGKIVLLVDPIYNIDGNERFGPMEINRPEQVGPALVGVRANGQGLDLNRDAIKAESPEMRAALSQIYNAWDPDVMMDLHTTDGTRHGFLLTYAPPMNPNTDPGIMRFTRDRMLPDIRRELKQKFDMPTFDYGNVEGAGSNRGFFTYGDEGRYCTHYVGLRGRIAVLSEAATFFPFKDRVIATDRFVSAVLEYVAEHAKEVLRLTKEASTNQAPKELGIRFALRKRGVEVIPLEHPRPAGSPPPFGPPNRLDQVELPIYDRFAVTEKASVPAAYLIPADQTRTVDLLKLHGISVERLLEPVQVGVLALRVSKAEVADRPFQGHRLVRLSGSFQDREIAAAAGWYLVRTGQPLGVLIFHLLEPEGEDGAEAWGFVDFKPTVGEYFPIVKLNEVKRLVTEQLPG